MKKNTKKKRVKKTSLSAEWLAEIIADELEDAGMSATPVDAWWFRLISDEDNPLGTKVVERIVQRLRTEMEID